MRWIFAAMLAVSGGRGCAAEIAVAAGGRFASPSGVVTVEWRVSDGAPIGAAAEKHTLKAPGLLAPAAMWRTTMGLTVRLDLCLVQRPAGLSEATIVAARVVLTNFTERPQSMALAVALLPEREVRALTFDRHAFFIEGQPVLLAETPSGGAILAESALAPRSLIPQDFAHVTSAEGQCRGEMFFDAILAPGQTLSVGFLCPDGATAPLDFYRGLTVAELFADAEAQIRATR